MKGYGLEDLIREELPVLHADMNAKVEQTELEMSELVGQGEAGQTYDVLIADGNKPGNELVDRVVQALMDETRTIEKIINGLQLHDVSIEGSSSLPEVR